MNAISGASYDPRKDPGSPAYSPVVPARPVDPPVAPARPVDPPVAPARPVDLPVGPGRSFDPYAAQGGPLYPPAAPNRPKINRIPVDQQGGQQPFPPPKYTDYGPGEVMLTPSGQYVNRSTGQLDTVYSRFQGLNSIPPNANVSMIHLDPLGGVLSRKVQNIYFTHHPATGGSGSIPVYALLLLAAVAAKVGDVAIGILSLPFSLIYEPLSFIFNGTLFDRVMQMGWEDQVGDIARFTKTQLSLFGLNYVFNCTQHALLHVCASIRYLTPSWIFMAGADLILAGVGVPLTVFCTTVGVISLAIFNLSLTAASWPADDLGIGLIWRCFARTLGSNGLSKTEVAEYRIFTCRNDPNAPELIRDSIADENRKNSFPAGFAVDSREYGAHPTRVLKFQRCHYI